MVPSYNSLTLIQIENLIDLERFKKKLLKWYADAKVTLQRTKVVWHLPVCYDLEFGIDLNEVATSLETFNQRNH